MLSWWHGRNKTSPIITTLTICVPFYPNKRNFAPLTKTFYFAPNLHLMNSNLFKKASPYFFILAIGTLLACTNSGVKEKAIVKNVKAVIQTTNDTPTIATEKKSEQNDSASSNYQTFFVVIADTNLKYSKLQSQMYALSDTAKIPVDTMERFYNTKKNLIALPDDYDDEIYAGDYYPRRFPSETLSLEYLNMYKKTTEKMIALVAGIYQQEKSADSALANIRNFAKNSFVVKSDIYVGCMH
jgi:hypothetical protein